MSKGFLAVIAVVVLLFIGIFAFSGHKSNSTSKSSSSRGTPTNHVEGQGKSGVTLVEYGDFQCPACEQYYPVVNQVVAEFKDQIYFQFRNWPITSRHPNAFAASRAAEAAAAQGKFWQMYDLLYGNQRQWAGTSDAAPLFKQYAKLTGLNVAQFEKDYASSKANDAINADMAAGNKLNVQGTPTFFLDGKEIKVNADPGSFESQIKAEIAKKQSH